MSLDPFYIPVILAAAVGGAGSGLLGVYVVGMRIPFVGVCMAHAAMAGAVFGILLDVPPLASALLESAAGRYVSLYLPLSQHPCCDGLSQAMCCRRTHRSLERRTAMSHIVGETA